MGPDADRRYKSRHGNLGMCELVSVPAVEKKASHEKDDDQGKDHGDIPGQMRFP